MAEEGLDLGDVRAALPEASGVGVATAVGTKAFDARAGADGQDDLDDAGDGQEAALSGPERAGVAAAFVEPGVDAVAGGFGEGDGADLVPLAVQAHGAGAGSDRNVPGVEAGAFLLACPGVEQDGEDGGVAGTAADGGAFDGALLGDREPPPASGSPAEDAIVARFVRTWESADLSALVALLTDDVFMSMPPMPFEYEGPDVVARFCASIFGAGRRFDLVPTRANGQPAFGAYLRAPDGISHGIGLYVLTLTGDRICAMTRFENSVLPWFGLPRSLPSP